jgi:hypothetical protein
LDRVVMMAHVSSTSPAGDSQRSNNPASAKGAPSFMPMWIGCLAPEDVCFHS